LKKDWKQVLERKSKSQNMNLPTKGVALTETQQKTNHNPQEGSKE
jgi:hypothetical protein